MVFEKYTDNEIINELAKRVKKRRLNLNITQKELALKSGLHPQTIKNFESGKSANLLILIQILRVFGDLDTLDLFIPDPGISPVQLLKLKGKERERASRKSNKNKADTEW